MPALVGASRQAVAPRARPSLRQRSWSRARPVTRQRSVVRHTTDSEWDVEAAGTTDFLLEFSGSTSKHGHSGVGAELYEKIDRDCTQDCYYLSVATLQSCGGDVEGPDLHYVALIKGVRAACDNGVLKCTHVPYIHDQLTGRRTASGTCQEDLYLQAKGELDQLTSYDVQLVDRTSNCGIECARDASQGNQWHGWRLNNGSYLEPYEEYYPPQRRQGYYDDADDYYDDDDYDDDDDDY